MDWFVIWKLVKKTRRIPMGTLLYDDEESIEGITADSHSRPRWWCN